MPQNKKLFADKVFNPIDHLIYKICGIKNEDMGWKKYALTLVTANAVMVFVGYLILRIQNLLFLNPNGIEGMESSLSFNTIISFMTNTNLQHYSGESGLSYAAQMCVIIFMMFTSAASVMPHVWHSAEDFPEESWGILQRYGKDHNQDPDPGIFYSRSDPGKSGNTADTDAELYSRND